MHRKALKICEALEKHYNYQQVNRIWDFAVEYTPPAKKEKAA
jgi:hypothetical protein